MVSLVGVVTAVTTLSVGAVVSIVKELTARGLLVLLKLSVTVMVQYESGPSPNAVELSGCVRMIVLPPEVVADERERLQRSP